MSLAGVIKSRRNTLNISQQDLAEMAGIGLATIKNIERGKGNPSIGTVFKIMEVLGMVIEYKVRQTI
ncbi:MAG: helix-turn-helix transcriptional regulator [Bacteroidales bacterium]|nr:helix-turn-helix transcriptional regulator [Bacteroidales bacterium]